MNWAAQDNGTGRVYSGELGLLLNGVSACYLPKGPWTTYVRVVTTLRICASFVVLAPVCKLARVQGNTRYKGRLGDE